MKAKNLNPNEYNSYYNEYITKTKDYSLIEGLQSNFETVKVFLESIPKDKLEYRYAVGKWTIKEIIQHIIDTERIFAYRALRIARKDQIPLPGFDQDEYVDPSKANDRTFESLMKEYDSVRKATATLFESFDEEMLMTIGTASRSNLSVRAAGFIIIGHENHHCEVIVERYL